MGVSPSKQLSYNDIIEEMKKSPNSFYVEGIRKQRAKCKTHLNVDVGEVFEIVNQLIDQNLLNVRKISSTKKEQGLIDMGSVKNLQIKLKLTDSEIETYIKNLDSLFGRSLETDPKFFLTRNDLLQIVDETKDSLVVVNLNCIPQIKVTVPRKYVASLARISFISRQKSTQSQHIDHFSLTISEMKEKLNTACEQGIRYAKAVYDYTSANDTRTDDLPDLSFQKNDFFQILNSDQAWWLVINLSRDPPEKGYVPNNYVRCVSEAVQIHNWYHGNITRQETEKQLLLPGTMEGMFAVRTSSTVPGAFALSVLTVIHGKKEVRHYKIRKMDTGYFYINSDKTFFSLEDLITHFQKMSDGMCCMLTLPMPSATPIWQSSRKHGDEYEIARNNLSFETKLGQGQFGEVWKGKWFNRPVAIKTLKFGSMRPDKFLQEAKVMKQLKHSKLVSLLGVCSEQQPFYIVTELVPKGSLLNYLRSETGRSMQFLDLISIASQVAEGMMYLEIKKCVHRDLATRNILVGLNNTIKIGDFGLAAKVLDLDNENLMQRLNNTIKIGDFGLAAKVLDLDNENLMQNELFPIKWTALEALFKKQFSIKSDVWAFGILLVELTTFGQVPYKDMSNREAVAFLDAGNRHPKPAQCPDEFYEQMLKCWKKIPEERPTFEYLNDFLNGYYINIEIQYSQLA